MLRHETKSQEQHESSIIEIIYRSAMNQLEEWNDAWGSSNVASFMMQAENPPSQHVVNTSLDRIGPHQSSSWDSWKLMASVRLQLHHIENYFNYFRCPPHRQMPSRWLPGEIFHCDDDVLCCFTKNMLGGAEEEFVELEKCCSSYFFQFPLRASCSAQGEQ